MIHTETNDRPKISTERTTGINGRRTKIIAIVMVSVLCAVSLGLIFSTDTVNGEDDFTYGDFTYWVTDDGAKIVKYNGSDTTVQIPNTILHNGVDIDVTAIGDSAFEGNSDVQTVDLPDNITSIGDYAFAYCSALQEIDMKDVTSVGAGIFAACSMLIHISINDDNDNFSVSEEKILLNKDGNELIAYPSASGNLIVPDLVTVIGEHAFEGCSLVSVDMNRTQTIGDYAFAYCSALQGIDMKDVTSVGAGIFAACSMLIHISINDDNDNFSVSDGKILLNKDGNELIAYPSVSGDYTITENIKKIGNGAFAGSDIVSIDTNNVTYIGASAFERCLSLNMAKGDAVKEIDELAFYPCPSLVSISFPEARTIGEFAFFDTEKLKTANLSSVVNIGESAFEDSGLEYITMPKDAEYDGGFPSSVTRILIDGNVYASVEISGSEITVTIMPKTGFRINSSELYYIDGGNMVTIGDSQDTVRTFDPSPSKEYMLSANTEEITHTVNVSVSEGKGTFKYRLNEEGEFIDVTGTLNIREGSIIEIVAIPSDGYEFVEWNDNSTDGTLRIDDLTADLNISAKFELAEGMVIVKIPAPDGKGSYKYRVNGVGDFQDVPEDNEIAVHEKCILELMAVPSDGYEFVEWSNGHDHPILKIDDVTGDMTVTAKFVESSEPAANMKKDNKLFIYLLILVTIIAISVSIYYVSKRDE